MASNYLDKNGLSRVKSKIAAMIAARVITWSEIQGKPSTFAPSSHTHDVATTAANGFMSSSDKSKLNGIAANANNYTLPTAGQNKLGGVKTTSAVASTSGYTACPIIGGVVYYKDTNTTYSLASFGITATAAELNKLDGAIVTVQEINYLDGVTANIQTQLNNKAAASHTHNYAGSASAGGAANSVKTSIVIKLNGGSTEGTNMFTFNGGKAKTVNITPSSIGAAASSHSHSAATQSASGFMAATDKKKLDGIATGANKYTHPSSHPASMIQVTVGTSNVALSDVLACAVFPISQTDEYVEFGDITEWVNAGKPKL